MGVVPTRGRRCRLAWCSWCLVEPLHNSTQRQGCLPAVRTDVCNIANRMLSYTPQLDIGYDSFIRTTDAKHEALVCQVRLRLASHCLLLLCV